MMRKVKGILFDFDGVLGNTMKDHFAAWKFSMTSFKVDLKEEEYYPLEGMTAIEISRRYCLEKGIDPSLSNLIVQKKKDHYLSIHNINLYPRVEEIIALLKSRGIKIGIVTASLQEQLVHSVPDNFLSNFDAIITGEKTKLGKPSPDPYLNGLKELDLKSEECIVVENAPLGITSAKSANIYCIAITSTVDKEKLKNADEIISNFANLLNSKALGYLK